MSSPQELPKSGEMILVDKATFEFYKTAFEKTLWVANQRESQKCALTQKRMVCRL